MLDVVVLDVVVLDVVVLDVVVLDVVVLDVVVLGVVVLGVVPIVVALVVVGEQGGEEVEVGLAGPFIRIVVAATIGIPPNVRIGQTSIAAPDTVSVLAIATGIGLGGIGLGGVGLGGIGLGGIGLGGGAGAGAVTGLRRRHRAGQILRVVDTVAKIAGRLIRLRGQRVQRRRQHERPPRQQIQRRVRTQLRQSTQVTGTFRRPRDPIHPVERRRRRSRRQVDRRQLRRTIRIRLQEHTSIGDRLVIPLPRQPRIRLDHLPVQATAKLTRNPIRGLPDLPLRDLPGGDIIQLRQRVAEHLRPDPINPTLPQRREHHRQPRNITKLIAT